MANKTLNRATVINFITVVLLTVRGMKWGPLPETVCRMAGFCSSAIAPALPYYRPSMDICKTCTSTIHGGRIRHPSVHGRIYSVSQATDPNSCLGWYKYNIIQQCKGYRQLSKVNRAAVKFYIDTLITAVSPP